VSYPNYTYPYDSSSYPVATSSPFESSSSPVVVYQSPPAATSQQPVIVVVAPQQPMPQEFTETVEQRSEKPIYLLVFKEQSNIRAAEAYWIVGRILHYVTLQHEQRRVPLDALDNAMTLSLNRQRGVDIRLSNTE
jgi:hypothetical protein